MFNNFPCSNENPTFPVNKTTGRQEGRSAIFGARPIRSQARLLWQELDTRALVSLLVTFQRMLQGIWWDTSGEQSWRRACFASQRIYKHFPGAGERDSVDDRATARKVIRGSWGKLFALQQAWVRTSLTQPSPSLSWHWTQGRKDTNHSATVRWKSVPKKSRPLPSWLEYAGGETNLDIELLKVVSGFSQFF